MAQFASADFTGTDGDELSAANAAFSKQITCANALIQSNRLCAASGATPPRYIHSAAPASADYEVSADFHVVTTNTAYAAGVLARAQSGVDTSYWARWRPGTGWQLFRYDAGTPTQLGSTVAETISAGTTRRIRLRCAGDVVSVYRDAETSPIITVTDASPITAAGYAGILVSALTTAGPHLDNWSADTLDAGDTTAPTLTSPTGTATGATTASGTVSTNEGNGTLYFLASTNASESAATVKAASSQAVSATGSQSVSFTGLTASTTYYAHYVHRDAAGNDSTVASSASFTTSAAGDTTLPTLTGTITISSLTTTSYTATWPAGSDNVAVTGYEYRIAGGSWVDRGNNLSVDITGRTPGATEAFEVRAYDAAGNRSTPALSASVTLNSATATVTVTEPLKNNTGTLLASQSGITASVLSASTLASVHTATGLTTNASGVLAAISNAALTTGQQYHVAIKLADGGVGITGPITAS